MASALGAADHDPKDLGRELTAWFLAGDVDRLWAKLPAPLRDHFQDAETLRAWSDSIREAFGPEKAVEKEEVIPMATGSLYRRVATFEKESQPATIEWTLDDKGSPVGFRFASVKAPGFTRHSRRETKAELRLPFDDEWTVNWGGRTVEENYHAFTTDQRFAYDLVITRDGQSHEGDGSRVEQYYCWDRPVLAPAAGVVVEARDDLPDQVPGEMDPKHPPGNLVVIDHGGGEFSLFAHLRKGSLAVKAGDHVARGQRLGACGNSGNTSEPHIHYHLQDRPGFDPAHAEGLPAQFRSYLADGKPVGRGEPVKGQLIRPEGR